MLPDPLAARARRDPLGPALVDTGTGERLTWADLDFRAQRWAWRLREQGVLPGQRVATSEPAGAELAAQLHGTLRAGAALVPLDPAAPAAAREAVLAACRPAVHLSGAGIAPLPDPDRGPEGDACVLYTSGTSGPPKGVRLTLRNHLASALGCMEGLRSLPDQTWLLTLGVHHVGGLAILFRSVFCRQPVVTVPRFSEAAVLAALEAERPSLVSLVPAMVERLLAAGGREALAGCHAILVGGAPAPAADVIRWTDLGLTACPSYGLTETCSQVAVVPPGRAREMAGSAGTVHRGARVEIEGGVITVAGPVVSPGYVGSPIARPLVTRDLGRVDGGVLHVLGRADDQIITGGENVSPEEVEAVLRQHPDVSDAAVAGLPDPVYGQVLEAVVVGTVGPEALVAFARERLPAFKVPRRVRFVPSLPRTAGGKLLRREL